MPKIYFRETNEIQAFRKKPTTLKATVILTEMLNSDSKEKKMASVWHRHSSCRTMGVPQYCSQTLIIISNAANPTFWENVASAALTIWVLLLCVRVCV